MSSQVPQKLSDFVFFTEMVRVNRTRETAHLSMYEPRLPAGYKRDLQGKIWGPDGNIKTPIMAPSHEFDKVQLLTNMGYYVEE